MRNRSPVEIRDRVILAAGLVAVAAGCSDSHAPPAAFQTVDSAGVQIVTTSLDLSGPTCEVSGPTVRIGSAEGDSEAELFNVRDAIRLHDGTIAVLNAGTSEVKIFAADGQFLHAFGREGDGPGEFRYVWSIFQLAPDTIVVADYRPWRFSYFTTSGEFVRAVQLSPFVIERPDVAFPLPDERGYLVEAPDVGTGDGFEDTDLPLVHYDATGAMTDTVRTFWKKRRGFLSRELRYVGQPIFGATGAVAHLRDDRFVYAPGRYAEFELWDASGALHRIVRWSGRDREVRPSDVEAWRQEYRAVWDERGRDPGESPFFAAEVSEERPVAEHFPAHDGLLVAGSGRVWLKRFRRPSDDGPDVWRVFEPSGRFVCRASLPEDLYVPEVGDDYFLAMERDALDVQYVTLREVSAPR